MSKKMLINASHPEEHRAVIVDDGALTELEIEVVGREQTRGNIYKAVVVRVETGLQAAFVDYGADRLGFLQMGEIHPSCYRQNENSDFKGRPRISDVLHRSQELLVQVVKEERGTKGAALTTFLSLPGRYMVLMPESDTKGVSRKIEEESQRKKLKSAMASMDLPSNMGYIVRTAGIGQTKEELKRDFDYLLRVYENILALAKRSKAPALVYKESNLVIRMIRDYFSADIDEVLVDDPKVFQEAKDFFQQVMPEYARLVKLHQEKRPIFSRYQIEDQIETINKNKVPLPSGGSIVIDITEALVAIDVNSGKMASEQGVEATAYKTNLEAAAEVGRQLRLRDLGGLIVIDFIDMRDRKHIREVEKCLKDALKNDKARVTIGHISSQFSLLEMSRQRIKTTLAEGSFLTCPHCDGSGRIKSTEAQAVAFLRKAQAGIAKGQVGTVEGEVPLEVATYLLNTRREELLLMERQHHLSIIIKGRSDLPSGHFELNFLKREKEELPPEYVDAASAAPLPLEELARKEPEVAEEQPAAAASVAETEEPAKKKRKRRRRKKKPGEAPSVPGEQDEDESEEENLSAEPVTAGKEPAEIPEAAVAADASEVTAEAAADSGEEPKTAKKPRRRRRKKPAAATEHVAAGDLAETETGAAKDDSEIATAETIRAAEPSVEVTEPIETQASAELPAPAAAEDKKKPARRRRKKSAAAAPKTEKVEGDQLLASTESSSTEAATGPMPVPASEPLPEATTDQPKPAPKRRAPRQKAAPSAAEPIAEPPVATSPAAPEAEAGESAGEKKKPARKPRASRAKPKAEELPDEAGEEAKPKRRAPRKKPVEPASED
jgi:ribonuclease E